MGSKTIKRIIIVMMAIASIFVIIKIINYQKKQRIKQQKLNLYMNVVLVRFKKIFADNSIDANIIHKQNEMLIYLEKAWFFVYNTDDLPDDESFMNEILFLYNNTKDVNAEPARLFQEDLEREYQRFYRIYSHAKDKFMKTISKYTNHLNLGTCEPLTGNGKNNICNSCLKDIKSAPFCIFVCGHRVHKNCFVNDLKTGNEKCKYCGRFFYMGIVG